MNFSDVDLLNVLNNYDFKYIDAASPFVVDDDILYTLRERSDTSNKVRVKLDGEWYFLKQIPWYCNNIDHVKFSHEVQRQLFANGFSLPEIILTKSNNSYCHYNDNIYFLTKFVSGKLYDYKDVEINQAITALAKMHAISEKIEIKNLSIQANQKQITLDHISWLRSVLKTDKYNQQLEALENEVKSIVFTPSSQCFPVHGDVIPWNWIFSSAQDVSLTDFDNSVIDSPLHDLAEFIAEFLLIKFKGKSSVHTQDISWIFPTEQINHTVKRYASVRPLSDADLRELPVYLKLVWIELLVLGIGRGDHPASDIEQVKRVFEAVDDNWSYR